MKTTNRPIPARHPSRIGAFLGAVLLGLLLAGGAARADLRVCNATAGRVGLAIGYLDGPVWVTEGWFNLKPNRCETIIRGRLASRYFYIHAVDYDRGGDWSGPNVLCTRDSEFSIRGPLDCYARGFERAGFIEIDTGQQADWTVELGDGGLVSGR
ncbi:DUF1036 domain-containing protein [Rhabdaerophilum calidifontis]|uniref:DUF1036 domain-containing protein n=1 Tax=Rhabdaerophilum calidifontis TaxID=2604328 RepID=UPI00123BA2EB|nr:DUF1036 domain-containing protein [Rhabdaerophilum calidifontis]